MKHCFKGLINCSGFSLVSMLVAVGILGILTVGFMELMRSSLQGQQKLIQFRDIESLKNEMSLLLDNEAHCRNSLAGPGVYGESTQPVFFERSKNDEPKKDGEGINVELWTSDQGGNARSQDEAMFSANKAYGSLTINSMKLFFPKSQNNENYSKNEEGHEDIGTLKVKVKTFSDETDHSFDIRISVFMTTDNAGQSKLISCSLDSSARRCGKEYKWNETCGCVTPEQHLKIQQFINANPTADNPCGGYSDMVEFNDYEAGAVFGKFNLCVLSKVKYHGKGKGDILTCIIKRNPDGTWVGGRDGDAEGGRRGGTFTTGTDHVQCSALCFGGIGEGCPAPHKFRKPGVCDDSCEPPAKWYPNFIRQEETCLDCGSRGYNDKCGICDFTCGENLVKVGCSCGQPGEGGQ